MAVLQESRDGQGIDHTPTPSSIHLTRRQFLRGVGLAAAGALVSAGVVAAQEPTPTASGKPLPVIETASLTPAELKKVRKESAKLIVGPADPPTQKDVWHMDGVSKLPNMYWQYPPNNRIRWAKDGIMKLTAWWNQALQRAVTK